MILNLKVNSIPTKRFHELETEFRTEILKTVEISRYPSGRKDVTINGINCIVTWEWNN